MDNHTAHPSDEELASFVQKGDTEKFGILMKRYSEKLFRYGRKFLKNPDNIEDIVQDVFLKAYQNIQSFDTTQRFSPWIYRIAHNTFINALKKEIRNPLYFFDFDTLLAHPVYEDPDAKEKEQERMRNMVEKGLEKLSPHYREILILYYLEDLKYKEIADILHIPVSTVGIRLKRAKDSLKRVWKELGISIEEYEPQ